VNATGAVRSHHRTERINISLYDGELVSTTGKHADSPAPNSDIATVVREKYGQAALRVAAGGSAGCCGPTCCGGSETGALGVDVDPITANLYGREQTEMVPQEAMSASLGCGNPTALATLSAGEVVLDLGSGGGIDVLLSAKRVGPTGKVYGLDMTDEMLALARANAARAGAANVEFLKGQIEAIPLPTASVDVIISNCVINLSGDKRQVLAEAFRVLKPGGRFAVSDVVVRGEIPDVVKRNLELWVGCVAGALAEDEFLSILKDVGFVDASIEPTRVYDLDDAKAFLASAGLDAEAVARDVSGRVMSGFIRARKPQ
jgi:arsenite methyltransferase